VYYIIVTESNSLLAKNDTASIIKDLVCKGQVQCFSMQVVMSMCFLLNPEKNFVQIRLVILAKCALQFRKQGTTEPNTATLITSSTVNKLIVNSFKLLKLLD